MKEDMNEYFNFSNDLFLKFPWDSVYQHPSIKKPSPEAQFYDIFVACDAGQVDRKGRRAEIKGLLGFSQHFWKLLGSKKCWTPAAGVGGTAAAEPHSWPKASWPYPQNFSKSIPLLVI